MTQYMCPIREVLGLPQPQRRSETNLAEAWFSRTFKEQVPFYWVDGMSWSAWAPITSLPQTGWFQQQTFIS